MILKVTRLWTRVRTSPVSRRTLAGVMVLLCLMLAISSRPFTLLFSALHSKDSLGNVAIDLNSQRTQVARDFFNLIPRLTFEELQAMSQPKKSSFRFTIALITTGRKKSPASQKDVGYVLQSAAAVTSLLKVKPSFHNSFLFVCNVDRYPNNHADAVVLKDYLPYVERYGGSTIPNVSKLQIPGTEKLYRDTYHGNAFDRERHDYTFCLQAAVQFKSQYYLILQDDAIPHPDFTDVLELSLAKLNKPQECLNHSSNSLLSYLTPSYASCLLDHLPYSSDQVPHARRIVSPSPKSSFAYIKFYFPERWQGFAFELIQLLDLASFGVVGGSLVLLFHAFWTSLRKQSFLISGRVFLLGIAVSLLMTYVVGRQNMNELRRVSKYFYRFQTSPRCCIPAMLYPAPVMPFLITWLADSPDESKVDLRISDCFQHYDVPAYYIEPNIVRHVGMVSTLPKSSKKPVEEFLLFR